MKLNTCQNAYKTAISRTKISTPLREIIANKKINKNGKILDFGCGKGKDYKSLAYLNYNIKGYDPFWAPFDCILKSKYDYILCTYVLNVVNKPTRKKIIKQLIKLTKPESKVYITVRRDIKKHKVSKNKTHQYRVKVNLPIFKETSSYCIYEASLSDLKKYKEI